MREGDCWMNYVLQLVALKTRSLRKRVWHRVLNRLERAQVNLTIKIVKRVKSPFLMKVLDGIISKLSNAVTSRVEELTRSIGLQLARKASRIADSWGNKSSRTWIQDKKFARFLAIVYLNASNKSGLLGN